tara:strand:+ start:2183 stop:3640 length:1458 start_codon:yes stop_codon:yes gene_type:complete
MKLEELEKIVANKIQENKKEMFTCSTSGECYRKLKNYFKDRDQEEVYSRDFDKEIESSIESGDIDRESYVTAWNQLADDGDIWYMGSGAKKEYVYTPAEVESALEIIAKDYSYDVKGNNIITRHETDQERSDALKDLSKKLKKMGYQHSPRGGTHGRLQLTPDGRSGVFIYFKWSPGAEKGGARAASAGMGKERELAQNIINAIGGDPQDLSQFVKTAGTGYGSDLQINLPGKPPLNIEVKTGIGADFGQFKFGYDLRNKKWIPIKTKEWYKGKNEATGELIPNKEKELLFMDIWNKQVLPNLPKNPFKNIDISNSPLNIKDGIVRGIKTSPSTSEFKNILAKNWFGGKESFYTDYNISDLAKYYANKGDGYIQISKDGLYGLSDKRKKDLGLNYTFLDAMTDGNVKARVRTRIKAHGGSNETHSFTAALKVSGRLAKSNIDLDTPEGIDKLVSTLLPQNESLTKPRITYKMLEQMVEKAIKKAT